MCVWLAQDYTGGRRMQPQMSVKTQPLELGHVTDAAVSVAKAAGKSNSTPDATNAFKGVLPCLIACKCTCAAIGDWQPFAAIVLQFWVWRFLWWQ